MVTEQKINDVTDSYLNGNITEFKQFLKRCSKTDLLNIIENLQSRGESRHNTINRVTSFSYPEMRGFQ